MGGVEGFAGESGYHNDVGETCGGEGFLTGNQQQAANAPAGPSGMDEEGADAGRFMSGVKVAVLSGSGAIATEDGTSSAPAAATDDGGTLLNDEVGAIGNQVPVDAEDGAECGCDLSRGIPLRLEG